MLHEKGFSILVFVSFNWFVSLFTRTTSSIKELELEKSMASTENIVTRKSTKKTSEIVCLRIFLLFFYQFFFNKK